eukprot:CAMPEP_0197864142 /NCGR_PEP_ID=MMETSP1438-20131217/42150_1 /TAXON_ID=1461541 /ORGANISM="Pterosperma sp., Strain CCMP1384" /LENGTH=378 /DNA_ID=CAMNT_0043482281 /DNA_START=157 /DNA_END=1289 /DNA_ORIENTATION=-
MLVSKTNGLSLQVCKPTSESLSFGMSQRLGRSLSRSQEHMSFRPESSVRRNTIQCGINNTNGTNSRAAKFNYQEQSASSKRSSRDSSPNRIRSKTSSFDSRAGRLRSFNTLSTPQREVTQPALVSGVDAQQFVNFFRQSSTYVQSHRKTVCVVVIPGTVVAHPEVLDSVLRDVTILHSLGVNLVLVVGCSMQIDQRLRALGTEPKFQYGARVTDDATMAAALEMAGAGAVEVTSRLSRGPSVVQLRRHGQENRGGHPVLRVNSGNYVAAKRRGIVKGVDYGETGDVRSVDTVAIEQQLDLGNVVLLSNMGYTAAGETLNCNTYEIATVAAKQLKAEKLVCMMDNTAYDNMFDLVSCSRDLPLQTTKHILQHLVPVTPA